MPSLNLLALLMRCCDHVSSDVDSGHDRYRRVTAIDLATYFRPSAAPPAAAQMAARAAIIEARDPDASSPIRHVSRGGRTRPQHHCRSWRQSGETDSGTSVSSPPPSNRALCSAEFVDHAIGRWIVGFVKLGLSLSTDPTNGSTSGPQFTVRWRSEFNGPSGVNGSV